MQANFRKDVQFYKFCLYGFLKNLRLFEPFLIIYLAYKGLNLTQVGLLYSAKYIIRLILEIPSGLIADALGRKASMLFSYLLYISSFLCYYVSQSFSAFMLATILFGIADAFRTGTHKAMILDYLRLNGWLSSKTEYYGRTRSWSQLGSAISAILSAIILLISGKYELIFLGSAIPYIIGAILLYTYPNQINGELGESNTRQLTKLISTYKLTIGQLQQLKKITALFSTSMYFGYSAAIKDYLQLIIQILAVEVILSEKFSPTQNEALYIGIAFFFVYLFNSAASKFAGKINSFFVSESHTYKTLAIFGLIAGICSACLLYFNLPLLACIMFIPQLMFNNAQRPAAISVISSGFNHVSHATILSIESQIGSLYTATFAFIMGFLSDEFGIHVGLGSVAVLCLTLRLFINPNKNTIENNNHRTS